MEVKLVNLTKEFVGKKGDKTIAVNDMTFDIPDGKLVGLLGPSGCGKSTTLYMIAGLHKPTAGQIFFGDIDVTNTPPENRGIGLVFQNYALYPHFSVRQNITFPLENVRNYLDPQTGKHRRYTRQEMNAIAYKMAKLVDIAPYLERKPKQLSGGQQQRVAIARALSKSPQVLLLDEPLSNLDARLRLQTREEIKRIQRETGITTIFVTHDQEEAMSISDFIIVMDKGVVQQIDEPQKVYDNPNNLFVAKFLGSPAINIIEGELENGKLLIDKKPFDKGYTAKGSLKLDDQYIYEILAKAGLKHSYEQFVDAVHGTMNVLVDPSANIMQTVPFVLNIENIVKYASANGALISADWLAVQIVRLKKEKKMNRRVFVGIRPEAFSLEEGDNGLSVDIHYIETIGRDISLVGAAHGLNAKMRIIVPSELSHKVSPGTLTMHAKRFFVFEEDGERIK